MAEILFPKYRAYYDNRVKVNDAMAALLAGSRLAGHTLSLTTGSTATLGQVFPAVEHIERFNMRSDVARDFLNHADHYIAAVAVPYALATHEGFVMDMVEELDARGRTLVTPRKNVRAWNMHQVVFETCGEPEPADWMQSFHVLREVRNCLTHAGGVVDQKLRDSITAMQPNARVGWGGLNRGLPPESLEGSDGQISLTAESVFTAFAVTKRLGREINALLGRHFSVDEWADIAVHDFAEGTAKSKNSPQWRRSLIGYVQQYYRVAGIAESELEKAARKHGYWTRASWSL